MASKTSASKFFCTVHIEKRSVAVTVKCDRGTILVIALYLPVDYGNSESV